MKNKFGLIENDMEEIVSILAQFPNVQTALIFGSRAKGNYRNGSDVDICLKGKSLNFNEISQISYQLNEETRMPYMFDVLDYKTIQEPALVDHIDRIGVEFYMLLEKTATTA
ncbi:nucleotidyltransferase family protein [Arundinibacter roseus]|uniref:Nucleotidyltransferase domain-containing protein n=1 Tax=Arundinibacter roseus TaxID=2070510 RepID=A0A4R4JUL0_9BACT|nr:nucleotidyltransferase domain-containing protein [Arundinibacter roseus]TDB58223.1 nucleotidyltransferase domain-containing protein [Arundinibacter roseus]